MVACCDISEWRSGSVGAKLCSEKCLLGRNVERCELVGMRSAEQCLARFRPTYEDRGCHMQVLPNQGAVTQKSTSVLFCSPSMFIHCVRILETLTCHVQIACPRDCLVNPDLGAKAVNCTLYRSRAEVRFRVDRMKLPVFFTICPRHSARGE